MAVNQYVSLGSYSWVHPKALGSPGLGMAFAACRRERRARRLSNSAMKSAHRNAPFQNDVVLSWKYNPRDTFLLLLPVWRNHDVLPCRTDGRPVACAVLGGRDRPARSANLLGKGMARMRHQERCLVLPSSGTHSFLILS
mmetsp:Transcript_3105/g.19146  ORF Transcript_3105/g.19146 Transcript_3105/m.19146 type:complete len:140 (+) Transcript_3105:475-894(+)